MRLAFDECPTLIEENWPLLLPLTWRDTRAYWPAMKLAQSMQCASSNVSASNPYPPCSCGFNAEGQLEPVSGWCVSYVEGLQSLHADGKTDKLMHYAGVAAITGRTAACKSGGEGPLLLSEECCICEKQMF
ncbi:MAG: hypothetical protein ABJI96_09650 [Paracoccaceae bacterium]